MQARLNPDENIHSDHAFVLALKNATLVKLVERERQIISTLVASYHSEKQMGEAYWVGKIGELAVVRGLMRDLRLEEQAAKKMRDEALAS